jgi:hypothetical protein
VLDLWFGWFDKMMNFVGAGVVFLGPAAGMMLGRGVGLASRCDVGLLLACC